MVTFASFSVPDTLAGLLVLVVALVILWMVISIPVYAAGKLVTAGKGTFGDAMSATLGGALAYILVLWGGSILLTVIVSPALAVALSFVLALFVWIAVYSASFDTGLLGGIAIAVVGWAVLVVMDLFLINVFGVGIPKFYPF
jgi:hypothetical protein